MAGDEAVHRPPLTGGGRALPPEPGGPLISQTAPSFHPNPKPKDDTPPCILPAAALAQGSLQFPAIPLVHTPRQSLPTTCTPLPHTTPALRNNPLPDTHAQPSSQTLTPAKSTVPSSAQSHNHKNPTAQGPTAHALEEAPTVVQALSAHAPAPAHYPIRTPAPPVQAPDLAAHPPAQAPDLTSASTAQGLTLAPHELAQAQCPAQASTHATAHHPAQALASDT
ncbi:hypothetical protein LIER_34723 [Lithospermum erythrorhizon]|uniref:Uncharacterized protein n=1 Tax=Lithospermum erythrorhizon TaxID=34254 RepID=A0AAV3S2M4_LITER